MYFSMDVILGRRQKVIIMVCHPLKKMSTQILSDPPVNLIKLISTEFLLGAKDVVSVTEVKMHKPLLQFSRN